VPADARLITGALEVSMAALTGESQPVARDAAAQGPPVPPLEAGTLVFAGTLCTEGQADAVVFATGMATQLGRIAALSQRVRPEPSPLQHQVNRAAWFIAAIAVALGLILFVAGITLAGLSVACAATAAIGLLVGNVPEGLLPTAVRCNNATLIVAADGTQELGGDPSESALLAAAQALGEDVGAAQERRETVRR